MVYIGYTQILTHEENKSSVDIVAYHRLTYNTYIDDALCTITDCLGSESIYSTPASVVLAKLNEL